MVHRPADSRLLSNLLQHEKDYLKSLTGQLEHSQVSIASFSAFAAASPPPTSHSINTIVGALVGADEALRQYASAVEEWCEMLKALKEMEEEVGSVMRDREILVDRLIKASKSTKSNRRSFISSPNPSHTHLSLSSDQNHSPLSNPKLTLAQSELQACEAHLAERERELADVRTNAIQRGLLGRCQALMECGRTWVEMGKEGVKALQALQSQGANGMPNGYGRPHPNGTSVGSTSPLRPSSDASSSISPYQSASQNGHAVFQGPTLPASLSRSSAPETSTVVPSGQQNQSYRLSIPPAHAISDQLLPPSVAEQRFATPEEELGGSSVEEGEEEQNLEVHENERFAAANKEKGKEGVKGKKRSQRRRKASTVIVSGSGDMKTVAERSRPGSVQFPTSSSAPVGFSTDLSSWPQPGASDDNILANTSRERKKSSFFNSITSLFKSSPTIPSYQPTTGANVSPSRWRSGSRWTTRTDTNLKRVKEDSSSDEGGRAMRTGKSDTAIDYEGLRRKSIVEAKALPEPGGASRGASRGGKRLRKASRKGGPSGGRGLSTESETKAGEITALIGGSAGASEGRKLSGRRSSKERPVFPPQETAAVYNANAPGSPESNVTVVRSSSRAASLDGARPVLRKGSGKRRSIDVVSDSGHAPSSTPPHAHFANGARSTPPMANSTRFPPRSTPGQHSLMSIVENVSAQNRANWGKTNPNSLLIEVKAPQSVVSGTGPYSSVHGASESLATPTPGTKSQAPIRNSANSRADARIGRPRSPTMSGLRTPDVNRLSTITASASTPSLPFHSGVSDVSSLYSQASGSPPSRPLRSAMRSPSPNPATTRPTVVAATSLNQNAQNQIYSPRIPGTTAADAVMITSSKMKEAKAKASTGTFGQPVSDMASTHATDRKRERDEMSNASSELTVNSPRERAQATTAGTILPSHQEVQPTPAVDTNIARPRYQPGHAEDPEKRWSINSFASADEDYQDAMESIPPTPPPRDESEAQQLQAPLDDLTTAHRDNSPDKSFTPSEHSQSTELGAQQTHAGEPSTAPAERFTPSEQSHLSELGAHQTHVSEPSPSSAVPPVRRKSVRVSLQPTFSATPPAMEEYEDEDNTTNRNRNNPTGKGDYWASRSNGPSTGSSGWTSRIDESKAGQIWEDSSEEEEEYSLAKQLLLRQIVGDKTGKSGHGRR